MILFLVLLAIVSLIIFAHRALNDEDVILILKRQGDFF